jgi:hypothetical protein
MICKLIKYHGTLAGSAARCLIFFISVSFMFGSKNNNILQLGSILINEANVLLESFFRFLAW